MIKNMQDLKEKNAVKNIKEKKPDEHFSHFTKIQTIHQKMDNMKEKQDSEFNNRYAIDKVDDTEKKVALETIYRSKKFVKNQRNKRKQKNRNQANSSFTSQTLKTKNKHDQLSLNTKESDKLSLKNNALYQKSRTNSKNNVINERTNISYQNNMKSLFMKKHKKKSVENTVSKSSSKIASKFVEVFKKPLVVLSKGVNAMSSLCAYGSGLILLVVLSLFIGIFGVLSNDGGINEEISPLSAEVLAYEEIIIEYANQYGIGEYVAILEAIMMQESGGKGSDPMQSSECGFNKKYHNKPNGITDAKYSIEVGVQDFADCLKKAKTENPDDTEKLYLALQGYNYGKAYIKWAIEYFGGYSKANAKVYSDNKKAELNVKVYGDPYYVEHVMRYVSFSFRSSSTPNFSNYDAWVNKNPYAQAKLYGQCTWFAWGRFYELYGYSPGFIGDGYKCVDQLLKTHPDKFERSYSPKAGAVFSSIGKNHVGIVIAVKDGTIVIQEGNLDGKTNTFKEAQKDWHTKELILSELSNRNQGVVFANPK